MSVALDVTLTTTLEQWAVRYSQFGHPSFCAVLEGACRLMVDGHQPLVLRAGDFLLMPATPGFTMSGFEPARPKKMDPALAAAPDEELRHGTQDGPPDVRLLGGYFVFGSPDAALMVSLLPQLVHVRGEPRLGTLVQLVGDEAREQRAGRELVLGRLVEVLLVEALARESALSRSAFFNRFTRAVGVPPMEYLVTRRMALAKDLLRRSDHALAEIAERVGHGSASAFSTAFSRHVGQPPARYARGH